MRVFYVAEYLGCPEQNQASLPLTSARLCMDTVLPLALWRVLYMQRSN